MNLRIGGLMVATLASMLIPAWGQTGNTAPTNLPDNAAPPAGGWAGGGQGQFGGPGSARRAQMRQHLFQQFDTNGDGTLNPQERAAMQAYIQQRRAQRQAARFQQQPGMGAGGAGFGAGGPGPGMGGQFGGGGFRQRFGGQAGFPGQGGPMSGGQPNYPVNPPSGPPGNGQ